MVIRVPAGPVTPHGWWDISNGRTPMMRLTAYDGSVEFFLQGGFAIPAHDNPGTVHLRSLKGLIPPWRHIDQRGATEDGVTQVDSLYDPIEVEMTVEVSGKTPADARRIGRLLIDSIDKDQQSTLDFASPDGGWWGANVRWFRGAPTDPISGDQECRQVWSLRLRADRGAWRGREESAYWSPAYDAFTDSFGYDTEADGDMGPDWPLSYNGAGGGYLYADGSQARWKDDPDDWLLTETREVVAGPRRDFATETDNQVVSIVLGWFQEFSLPDHAANDIWVRMGRNPDGSWNGDGIRVRFQGNWIKLSRFNGFSQTVMRQRPLLIPALYGEKLTVIAGTSANPRHFKVMRGGLEILSHKETGTGSALGPDHRGVGFGGQAGRAIITQATPAPVRKISAGDNKSVTQHGFVERRNPGDQKMYDDYTVFGPGTFRLWDGPGATDYVQFGPLLPGQVVFLRTDPRVNTTLVQDLTATPASPQELNIFQDAVSKFVEWAGLAGAFGDQITSLFGVKPPQGNLYALLSGRFSDRCAIPGKSPGEPVKPYFVRVEVEGGDADSKVLVSGTPLRKSPR